MLVRCRPCKGPLLNPQAVQELSMPSLQGWPIYPSVQLPPAEEEASSPTTTARERAEEGWRPALRWLPVAGDL